MLRNSSRNVNIVIVTDGPGEVCERLQRGLYIFHCLSIVKLTMATPMAFTCITCHVAFSDGDIQREHYKSDWHRYNLKRKVAELPHVTAERFRERVLAQQAGQQPAETEEADALYCQPCRKPFRSEAQHRNHLQSRRHQDQQRRWDADEEARKQRLLVAEQNRKNIELSGQSEKDAAPGSPRRPPRAVARQPVSDDDDDDDDDDMSVEEVDSDEWEEWGGDGIPPTDCLFCAHSAADLAANVRHMTQAHSFFVPDVEYVTDMEGLIAYLGQKVGEGFVCLWCNERGKHFTSVEAVQKHMRDKGHTKMLHEGEVLAEYADYYDYSNSYPAGEDDDSAEPEQLALDADGFQLVLPSGAVVGHRALARYYRQRLRPEKAVALRRTGGATTARDVLHQYRLMGWTGSSKEQLKRTARDMQVLRRHQMKSHMRLGVKANRLQKHFRQQNPV